MSTKDSTFGSFARSVSLPSLAPLTNEQDGRPLTCDLNGVLYVKESPGAPISVTIATYIRKRYSFSPVILPASVYFTPSDTQFDLLEVSGFKVGTSALRYVQFFDAIAVPPNGTRPKISIALPGTNTSFSISYNPLYIPASPQFLVGGIIALSTTPDTLTLAPIGQFCFQTQIGSYV